MDIIKARHSIRKYTDKQISREDLELILEAGNYAPNAGGGQRSMMVAVHNAKLTAKIGRMNLAKFDRSKLMGGYVSKEQPSIADDPKLINAFYDAPTVITLFAPKHFLFAQDDCAVAAENMMLAADALSVGSCYIGQGWPAFDDPYGQEVLKAWNIRTDYYAVAQLLLGYPREGDKHPTAKPRKKDRIIRIGGRTK